MTLKGPGHRLFYRRQPEVGWRQALHCAALWVENLAGVLEVKIAKKMCYCLLCCAVSPKSSIQSLFRVGWHCSQRQKCYHELSQTNESRRGPLCNRGSLKCV